MKTGRYNLKKGVTLVEAVIYLGLLSLILSSMVFMLINMSKAYKFLKSSRRVQSSSILALDRMVREIRNASSVNVAQSTLDANPGVLTLNTTTSTSSAQVIKFFVSNGELHISQDGGDLGALTYPGVTVTNFVARRILTGQSEAVKIEITMTSDLESRNFYTTAILRDSY